MNKDQASQQFLNNKPDIPYGFIQWKGTDVCMDVHCNCGSSFHIDGFFAYSVECPECGQGYVTNMYIALTPIDESPTYSHIVGVKND